MVDVPTQADFQALGTLVVSLQTQLSTLNLTAIQNDIADLKQRIAAIETLIETVKTFVTGI